MEARASLSILLCSVALTGAVGLATVRIQAASTAGFPLFYDPVEYSFHDARLHARLADEGRLALAAREWLGNDRNPLRTVPLILFAPGLLAHPLGHLATTLPALLAFLALLGWTVKRRSGSLAYALASMALFCAIPRLYDPTIGLGANWLDLPASLLVGAAVLCLVSSDDARDARWLAAFAVLASCAALGRYVAAAFALVAGGPVLLLALFQAWRRERSLGSVLRPLALVALVVGVLAGPMLVAHARSNLFYYSELAYGLRRGPADSARFLRRFLLDYVDPGTGALRAVAVGAVMAVVAAHAWTLVTAASRRRSGLVVTLWLAGGTALFIVGALQTPADPSPALYVLPGAFVALVTPVPTTDRAGTRRLARLSLPLGIAALVVGTHAAWSCARWASQPELDPRFNLGWVTGASPDVRARKAFDVALAGALSGQGRGLVWSPFFDETSHIHSMEAFYRFGSLVLPAGPRYFSIHEAYWKGFYPGLSPAEIADRVYAATLRWVDVAVVLEDPGGPTAGVSRVNPRADNPVSRLVARRVAGQVAVDPRWRRVFRLESGEYGAVAGYRNLDSRGRGYEAVLRSHSLFFSPIDP